MTLKASSTKKTALNLFLQTLKKNAGITVLVTVFMLLICPGYALVEISDYFSYMHDTYSFDEMLFTGLNFSISFLTCAFAGIGCFLNFAFMYSKKSGDVYFALPTTRNGLLFSRLGASIVPALIPVILCYTSMGFILTIDNVTGSILNIITGALLNIMLVVLTGCVTMLFIVCAGTITDLLLSFFGVNIGLFAAAAMIFELCDVYLHGFYFRGSEGILYSSSPFLYAFAYMAEYSNKGLDLGFLIYVIRVLATAAICLLAAVILFRKRKAEKCTTSYAYRGMYYVCSVLVGFLSAFMFGMIFSGGCEHIVFWIFALIGGVLGTITFGLITDRGFKTVKKSIITGVCSFAVLIVIVIILSTGGLGYSDRVPKVKSIESVTVSFNNLETEFTNPQLVIDLHKKIVSGAEIDGEELVDYYEIQAKETDTVEITEEYFEDHTTTVHFNYQLKHGFELNRTFWIDTKDCAKEILAIYKSEENINTLKKTASDFIEGIDIYADNGEENPAYIDTYISKAECEMLIDAYTKDLIEADENLVYGYYDNIYISGTTSGQEYNSIELEVCDDFENTKEIIKTLNLEERSDKESKKYYD